MTSFKDYFSESKLKYVVLLPGGYKPPTRGHMHLIEEYNKNPLVEKVLVLIGPKEREGITREHAMQVFDLYGAKNLQKVTIEPTVFDNPMQAAFSFVESDPRAEEYKGMTFGIGASNKGDDAIRARRLVVYFEKNPTKLRKGYKVGIPPIVNVLQTNDTDISATDLRLAIRNKDRKAIKRLIPEHVNPEVFLSIFEQK
jgi:hypothetical protein